MEWAYVIVSYVENSGLKTSHKKKIPQTCHWRLVSVWRNNRCCDGCGVSSSLSCRARLVVHLTIHGNDNHTPSPPFQKQTVPFRAVMNSEERDGITFCRFLTHNPNGGWKRSFVIQMFAFPSRGCFHGIYSTTSILLPDVFIFTWYVCVCCAFLTSPVVVSDAGFQSLLRPPMYMCDQRQTQVWLTFLFFVLWFVL